MIRPHLPDVVNEEIIDADVKMEKKVEMNEVSRNLHNFKLDHDYTSLIFLEDQRIRKMIW